MSAAVKGRAFKEFSWLRGDLQWDHAARFAARMKDLGHGVQKCLQLIEASELDRSHGAEDGSETNAPLLNPHDTSVLLRFALAAAEIIGDQADEFIAQAQSHCDQPGATAAPGSAADDRGGRQ